jgi:hypothetical protein
VFRTPVIPPMVAEGLGSSATKSRARAGAFKPTKTEQHSH